jgi:hypothetical protein
MAQKVGNLVVEMSANVARLQRDFNKATTSANKVAGKFKSIFKGLGLSLAAGLSVAALKSLVKNSIDAADAIAKGAAKANLATGTFQELTFALDKFDVSQEMAASGLSAFTKRLGEARAGTGALTTFLKKYDQALLDSMVSAESNEEALDMFMKALGGVKNDADRAALSAAAFSRSAGLGMASAFKDGGVALDAWRKKARALGIVIDDDLLKKAEDAKDQMAALGQVIQARTVVAVAELAPQISRLAESLAKSVPDIQAFAGFISDIADKGFDAAAAIKQLDGDTGGWLSKLKDNLPVVREWQMLIEAVGNSDEAAAAIRKLDDNTDGWLSTLKDNLPVIREWQMLLGAAGIVPKQEPTTLYGPRGSALNPNRTQGPPIGKPPAGPPPLSESAAKVIKQLQFEKEQLGRTTEQQRIYNELKKAEEPINSAAGRTISSLVVHLERQKTAQEAAKDAAIAHSAALEKQAEDSQLLAIRAAEIFESVKTPRERMMEGIAGLDVLDLDPETYRRAFNQLGADFAATVVKMEEETTELSEFIKEAFHSMQNVASDFFFDVLEGNFTDLGDSFRKMVNRMLADWASVKMMGGLFGEDFGKTGELGGIIGGIFGGARALGGPVMAGNAYLVGERGPELFMPQTSGNVVANNKLGGGTSISVPIGNIDGGSKQLLANLPGMIENAVLESMRRYA